jgi:hypothetical protein
MLNLKDSKVIKRKVLVVMDNRITPRDSDYCTMTIYPSGIIGFRGRRAKSELTIPISSIYKIALTRNIENEKPKRKTLKVSRGLLSVYGIHRGALNAKSV